MSKSKVSQSGLLTKRQLDFVSSWSGSSVAAARAAGYSDPQGSACKIMKNEPVTDLLKEKQQEMARASGRALAARLAPSRIDIINHLWKLARLSPKKTNNNITGQMKATDTLAEIFALKIDSQADFDSEVEGKTQAEIDFFVTHGYFPEPQDATNGVEMNPAGQSTQIDGPDSQETNS
jgi:hypothetical protein